ncbi:uncharacterized protein LOC141912168 [Tubulanus polymorphus]|uniref:uncharacterized protein LOC141912168 n=1 Tax=Tubulanus polymorphus TaxID=672921 RepID=UPI003DA6237B
MYNSSNNSSNKVNPTRGYGGEMSEQTAASCSDDQDANFILKFARGQIHPRDKFIRIWEDFIVVCAIVSVVTDIFAATIVSNLAGTWAISYLVDFFWVLDIAKRFLTPMIRDGKVIHDRKLSRQYYLRGQFTVDLLAILPLEIVVAVLPAHMKTLQYVALFKVNRVLRFYRIVSHFDTRENELGSNTSLIRLIKYSVLTICAVHLMACLWFVSACDGYHLTSTTTCSIDSWAMTGILNLTAESHWESYSVSFYYAVAMSTSTGYGDISAVTTAEKAYSLIGMLIGISLFFGMLIGGITSALTNADFHRANYVHRLNVIKSHLNDMQLTHTVKKLVLGYYDYLWVRKGGQVGEGLFSGMSNSFQAEIALALNQPILEKAPLFADLGEGFLRSLSMKVESSYALPGQDIVTRGEFGSALFFIQNGEVEVLDEDDETPVATLRGGKLFGELSLILELPRTATVRAVTHCDLMVLNKAALVEVLKLFPGAQEKLISAAKKRLEAVKSSSVTKFKAHATRADSGVLMPNQKKEIEGVTKVSNVVRRKLSIWENDAEIYVEPEQTPQTVATTSQESGSCSSVDEMCSQFSLYLIHPKSKLYRMWNIFITLVALLVFFLYTYEAFFTAFEVGSGYMSSNAGKVTFAFSYVCDLCFIIDIAFNLRTAVVTANGLQKDQKSIALYYLRHGLILDILAVLPLELISLVWTGNTVWTALVFLRLNRLFKAWKIFKFFESFEMELSVNITLIRFLKLLVLITVTTHMLAAIWYTAVCHLPNFQCLPDSWIYYLNVAADELDTLNDVAMNYVRSIYWAATSMSSTGYGDITARRISGHMISVVAMIAGVLVYGYCVALITATVANLDSPKVIYQERVFALKEYLSARNLAAQLQERVLDYLGLLWDRFKGQYIPGGTSLMYDIPVKLQMDIANEEILPILGKVSMFEECDEEFLQMLALHCKSYLFMPHDIIVYSGDVGRELYCIRRGTCRVVSDDFDVVLNHLSAGEYFGEMGLIFGEPRMSTIQAVTHCDMIVISKSDLDHVLSMFPDIKRQFMKAENSRNELLSKSVPGTSPGMPAARAPSRLTPLPSKNRIASMHDLLQSKSSVGDSLIHKPPIENFAKFNSNPKPGMTKDELDKVVEFNKPFLRLNPVARFFSKMLMNCTLLPRGQFLWYWTIGRLILSFIVVMVTPMFPAFIYFNAHGMIAAYILDFLCLIDMYVSFHIGYYNKKNVLVSHPLKTSRHYLKTNFLIDLVSILPFELIGAAVFGFQMDYVSVKVIALCRFNRILLFYRLPLLFSHLEDRIETRAAPLRAVKCTVYTVVFIQLMLCSMFILACPPVYAEEEEEHHEEEGGGGGNSTDDDDDEDEDHHGDDDDDDDDDGDGEEGEDHEEEEEEGGHGENAVERIVNGYYCREHCWLTASGKTHLDEGMDAFFVNCFYWASATALSVGYGDLSADVDYIPEMVYAFAAMVLGVAYFGWVIASVAAVVANADASKGRFQARISNMAHFMKDFKINEDIQSRMMAHYEYVWRRTAGIDPESLFNGLPVSLLSDITYSLYKDVLGNLSVFRGTDTNFRKMIARRMQPLFYLKGEYILHKNDIGTEMFFIQEGFAEVVNEDTGEVLHILPTGTVFGEMSLLSEGPRSSSIRAGSNVDVFQLKKKDMDDVLTFYPNIKQNIIALASERTKKPSLDIQGTPSKPMLNTKAEPKFWETEWTISPHSILVRVWDKISVVLALVSSFLVTYQASFHDYNWGMFGFNYACEIFFSCEIYLNLHRQFYDMNGNLVTDHSRCREAYKRRRSGLAFDLISTLPLDVFAFAAVPEIRYAVLTYLRVHHLFRLLKVRTFFQSWEDQVNVNLMLVRVLQLVFQLAVCIHLQACIWFVIACPGMNCSEHSWFIESGTDLVATTPVLRYMECLYWVVATMTSTGFGDIHAYTQIEMVIASLVMFVGKLMFGFVLANIASTQSNTAAHKISFDSHIEGVNMHLKERKANIVLKQRITDYYEYIWARNRGVDSRSLFPDAPYTLIEEIFLSLYDTMLHKIELLKDGESSFFRMLAPKVKIIFHLPGDFIAIEGDYDDHVLYIHKGQAQLESLATGTVEPLAEGSVINEQSLIYRIPHQFSLKAVSHVDIFALSKSDLHEVLSHYPELREKVKNQAEKQYGHLRGTV